mgnify:CR=1 FL=1
MYDVSGKVALVTGGASGIGAETARLLAAKGAAVAIADINAEAGAANAKDINAAGGEAVYLPLDVSSESAWEATMAAVLEKFGGLHILVNGAGIELVRKIADTSLADFQKVMAVNLDGVFLGIKYAMTAMRDTKQGPGGGSIINISSIYGIVGSHAGSAYHSSKGAVRTFTKSAAIQCAADRIRVNSVHPGFVDTPLTANTHADPELMAPRLNATPLGRFGTAEDIAMGCLFLASDESAWMTGSELVIDGGMLAQ